MIAGLQGTFSSSLLKGEEALKNFINVRYEITGETPERKEHWDYPLPALREALMNALVHRDYFKKHEQILIKIYDDKIWFHNPGGLPKGLSIEQLKEKPQSVPRNPLIARIFYLAGYIERYGSGIQRILTSFADAGLPEPEFKTDTWGLTLTMRKDIFTEEYLAQMGLNERQVKAVMHVKKNGRITNKEFIALTPQKVTAKTASRDLKGLCESGILAQIGTTGKGTYYILSSACPPKEDIKGT